MGHERIWFQILNYCDWIRTKMLLDKLFRFNKALIKYKSEAIRYIKFTTN